MSQNEEILIDTLTITINQSNLSLKQKAILNKIYITMKEEIDSLLNIFSKKCIKENTSELINIVLKIVCLCIKYLEKVKINKKPLNGEDKKLISLELGKIVIKNEIKDKEIKDVILSTYELSAEPVLEGIIDVSKEVNTFIKKNSKKIFFCCN